MTTTSKNNCSGKIRGDYRDVSGRVYACSRKATVERDGQGYCWQHDPERIEVDKQKRRAAEDAKWDRRSAMYALRARNAKLGALVTLELAELLERLATHVPYTLHTGSGIATQARALAAQIREVLNE